MYFSSSQWVKCFALMAENYNGNAEKQGALIVIKHQYDADDDKLFGSQRRAQMQLHKAQGTKTCHEE
jgi:hypothetical protein